MLVDQIRKKSRQAWLKEALAYWINLRIMVQEHGEMFFVLGVAFGIFFVLFYKLVVLILVLAILASFAIWFIAPPESDNVTATPPPASDQANRDA